MAKVGYIVVCEEVFNDRGDVTLRKPYNVITPYSVPGNFSFVLAFSMFDLKVKVQYKLKIEITQPTGSNLIEEVLDFDFTPPDESDPLASGAVNLKFNNILFKQEGIHTFRVTINDQTTSKLMIPVLPSGQ
ncbi:hypothetical protein MHI57_18175 [Cytobacillus sp. FSL K6-0129]|uniref:DUF6941 family protein n=1 Tax=Cytobacillus sp. FSL K6-0129 TaxID=2921421 RepID=UPI0030FA9BEE